MEKSRDKFFLRMFLPDDYLEYSSWWKELPPPTTSLPRMGFVIGDMKCVGFLANTDTDFMIMTWYHCNPKNTKKESYEAMRRYIIACIEYAKLEGKNYLFCYTGARGIIRLLESLNFTKIEEGHMALKVY